MTKAKLDDAFKQVGHFGLYQLALLALVGSMSFVPAVSFYNQVFTLATPDFRCQLSSSDTLYETAAPTLGEINVANNNGQQCYLHANSSSEKKCDKVLYSNKYFERTVITDWRSCVQQNERERPVCDLVLCWHLLISAQRHPFGQIWT